MIYILIFARERERERERDHLDIETRKTITKKTTQTLRVVDLK